MSKSVYVLHNPSGAGRYFAGITSGSISEQKVVTSGRVENAKRFSSKKEAQDKMKSLENCGHKFEIVELTQEIVK